MSAPSSIVYNQPLLSVNAGMQALQAETKSILADTSRFTGIEQAFVRIAEAGCVSFDRFSERFSKTSLSAVVENTYRELQAEVLMGEIVDPQKGVLACVNRTATRTAFNCLGALKAVLKR